MENNYEKLMSKMNLMSKEEVNSILEEHKAGLEKSLWETRAYIKKMNLNKKEISQSKELCNAMIEECIDLYRDFSGFVGFLKEYKIEMDNLYDFYLNKK